MSDKVGRVAFGWPGRPPIDIGGLVGTDNLPAHVATDMRTQILEEGRAAGLAEAIAIVKGMYDVEGLLVAKVGYSPSVLLALDHLLQRLRETADL